MGEDTGHHLLETVGGAPIVCSSQEAMCLLAMTESRMPNAECETTESGPVQDLR